MRSWGITLALGALLTLSTPCSAQYGGTHDIAPDAISQAGAGVIDRGVLLAFLESASQDIDACLAREFGREGVTGRIVLELTLTTSGAARPVRATGNTTGSASLARCITGLVRRHRFAPAPTAGSVTYTVPIELHPYARDMLRDESAREPSTPFSRVTIDEHPSISGIGQLDPYVALRLMRTRTSVFRVMFERAVTATPSLRGGDLSLQFTIEESGSVTDVHATPGTLSDASVLTNYERIARGFRFNPGADGGTVTLTFHLVVERLREGPPPPAAPAVSHAL